MNDFLLAMTVLCLALCMWKKRNSIADDPSASGQLEVLKQSYILCTEKSPSC